MQNFLDKFFSLIEQNQKILITSHIKPDDDSISSVLSLYSFLESKYSDKNFKIIYTGGISDRFSYFKNFDLIESVEDISEIISDFDLVIYLDGGQFHRFSNKPELLDIPSQAKICIDHHLSTPDKFDIEFIDSSRSSCVEIIYDLFYKNLEKIDIRDCELILLGILGDTGTFRYLKPHQMQVFDIVKRLINDSGIEIQDLKAKYEGYTMKASEVAKIFIKNSEIFVKDNIDPVIISLFREEDKSSKFSGEDISEGKNFYLYSFSMGIKGVKWSMVFSESKDFIKVSMRSLPGSMNVRILCENLAKKYNGKGGGHDRASGLTVPISQDLSMEKLIAEIKVIL